MVLNQNICEKSPKSWFQLSHSLRIISYPSFSWTLTLTVCVTEPRFDLKANTWETSVDWKKKKKVALITSPAPWGEGRFVSKNLFQTFCMTSKVFKERIIWGGGQSLRYHPLCANFFRLVGSEVTQGLPRWH